MSAYIVQKFLTGIALYMGYNTLLMARRVNLKCGLMVEPYTATTLIGIATTAQGRMVQLVKLLVKNVKTC